LSGPLPSGSASKNAERQSSVPATRKPNRLFY
jgi:hypothetical protein